MNGYRKLPNSVSDIKYHAVRIAKYRKPILYGDAAVRVRDLIREICKTLDIEIVKRHVSKDHIHFSVSVPPYLSVSKRMRNIEGKTSRKLLNEYRRLSKSFWGRYPSRGYTDDAVAEYIAIQDNQECARDNGFLIG